MAVWSQIKVLYARSVCDTTAPLQLQLPLVALYRCNVFAFVYADSVTDLLVCTTTCLCITAAIQLAKHAHQMLQVVSILQCRFGYFEGTLSVLF